MPPSSSSSESAAGRQHGVKGVYYGGEWVDIEDCDGTFNVAESKCSGCDYEEACPRSRSRKIASADGCTYDVMIVGAGCVGASIARELAKYRVSVLWVEAADDVSQGATKGNSGIVHAGYDDKPGTKRAKYCWKGNQMFAQLDKELRFGYQKNGSLVVAFNDEDRKHLIMLKKRGETNGVKNLRIVDREELHRMEPALNKDAVAALYSPDAGNVIPYEFTIALAENAVDNGIELRVRRLVTKIEDEADGGMMVTLQYWEPKEYVGAVAKQGKAQILKVGIQVIGLLIFAHWGLCKVGVAPLAAGGQMHVGGLVFLWLLSKIDFLIFPGGGKGSKVTKSTPLEELVNKAGKPLGTGPGSPVEVDDMLVGGSGSSRIHEGAKVEVEKIKCSYVINCAGGAADKVARLVGDHSFNIKPRLGDYLLLNRNQGRLANHTIFPCPDPILGKGVLVQTTLWGNLILGPTARDVHNPDAKDMSPAAVQEYILSKCKRLVPSFDPEETIHAFCGARAKSDRGDWIIEPSKKNGKFINVAGIDSPGLAGSPAIALEVVKLLGKAGMKLDKNSDFNPNRAPIITPKAGMKGLKMGPVGKFDSDGSNTAQMASNVICKCEKVTELEVVRAMRRSLPIDSSQAIRKRTRAGMGHCQGHPDNYNCEARVRAIIARENGVSVDEVGARPWPATSTLTERWIEDKEKKDLVERMNKT